MQDKQMQNRQNNARLILFTVKAMMLIVYKHSNNSQLLRNPMINSNGFLVKGVGIHRFQKEEVDKKIKSPHATDSSRAKMYWLFKHRRIADQKLMRLFSKSLIL